MVKQFSIPCQFGQETSPVTLYIGHPENTHHPVHFQSDWLSTTKGGTIPQDLMDTLQKLHDLSIQNGADFEELCYYALISATQHGTGNGVSPEDINKYADEFVKSEGKVAENTNNTNHDQNNNTENNQTNNTANTPTNNSTEEQPNDPNNNTTTKPDTQSFNSAGNTNTIKNVISEVQNAFNNQSQNTENKINPSLTINNNQNTPIKQNTASNNTDVFQDDADLLNEFTDNIETAQIENNTTNKTSNPQTHNEIIENYSQEDEDLLLMDELEPMDE